MKRVICSGLLYLVVTASFAPASAFADSREHHAALRLCMQTYRDAVRGTKRLKSHDRKERIAQARKEREECEKLAPR